MASRIVITVPRPRILGIAPTRQPRWGCSTNHPSTKASTVASPAFCSARIGRRRSEIGAVPGHHHPLRRELTWCGDVPLLPHGESVVDWERPSTGTRVKTGLHQDLRRGSLAASSTTSPQAVESSEPVRHFLEAPVAQDLLVVELDDSAVTIAIPTAQVEAHRIVIKVRPPCQTGQRRPARASRRALRPFVSLSLDH